MNVLRKVELTAFQLKCIAMGSIIVWVSSYIWISLIPSSYYFFLIIWMLVPSIVTFFVAEGYYQTKNVWRYALRLTVWVLLSQIPFIFYSNWSLHSWGFFTWRPVNGMFTLLLGLLALTVWKKQEMFVLIRIFLIAVLCALSWAIQSQWAVWGILMVLAFGMFHGCYWKQCIAFFIVVAGILIQLWIMCMRIGVPYSPKEWLPYLCLFLPLLILWMYRGKKGGRPTLRWMFYVLYPTQFILYYTILFPLFKKYIGH